MSDIHPLAILIAACARGISGVQVTWVGCRPEERQRIYFANHTSHLDFVVLWSALPPSVRSRTHPVAARDYWQRGIRAYLAKEVFRAVFVDRNSHSNHAGEETWFAAAHKVIDDLSAALGESDSLIIFPEGTRGSGECVGPFRSGIYHLARKHPEVDLVPAYLENLSRILPKGELLPVPLLSRLTFGEPMRIHPAEAKEDFLARARAALESLRRKEQRIE
jgi:1-acyl-sn-glycerol-3-phosphate acyltransferase